MVAIPVIGLRASRPHPNRTTVQAAALDTRPVDSVSEHIAPDRASRSAGWARAAIEQMPIEDFASTTVAPAPSTVAPVRRVQAASVTTVRPRPKPAATTTTTRPRPKPAAAPPATAAPKRSAPPTTTESNAQSGKASYYEAAPAGTCAHRTLPKGTTVTVTATASGKSITCVVSDRGPYAGGFIIDLAKSDFAQLAPISQGVVEVRLTW
jgi:rare lipoprotein A